MRNSANRVYHLLIFDGRPYYYGFLLLCCFGKVGDGVLTVCFTYRKSVIRIFGAGYWRKGKRIYEE